VRSKPRGKFEVENMRHHKKQFLVFLILVFMLSLSIRSVELLPVEGGKYTSHTIPDWQLTVGNGTTNTVFSMVELMHMPFYSLYGTNAGIQNDTGYWGGILLRDLIAPYVKGAWEYEVEVTSQESPSKNISYSLCVRNDTLVAFWLDSNWLDPQDHGNIRLAPLNETTDESLWVKNVTQLRIHKTNMTATPRVWSVEIDAYRDIHLDYNEFIHQGVREIKFGTVGSSLADPGYYIGYTMKNFLEPYVGSWVNYQVTVFGDDGSNVTADWALANSETWFCAYGINGSQFGDIGATGWVRLVSLNDTSPQAQVHSLKNITKIVVLPLDVASDIQWNLTIRNVNDTIAFYTPLNLTIMDYLEGPLRVFRGCLPPMAKGIYIIRGVNLTALLSQYFELEQGVKFEFRAFDGFQANGNMSDVISNATHTTILAWEVDGGHVDHTENGRERSLLIGHITHDPQDLATSWGTSTHTLSHYLGIITFIPATTPPPTLDIMFIVFLIAGAGGFGAGLVVLASYYFLKKKEP
jgi:hypothetical protein